MKDYRYTVPLISDSRFHGTAFTDRERDELFSAIGQLRSPFRSINAWKPLDHTLQAASKRFLQTHGADKWEEHGGIYDDQGIETCRYASPMAADVVREIAKRPGGLFWQDSSGSSWAVRLVSAGNGSYFGFAIGSINSSQDLTTNGSNLRFHGRAEQVSWLIHFEVLRQQQSTIVIPDIIVGQAIWGGQREKWPKNWRQDIMRVLMSLCELRAEVLHIGKTGWQPRLGAYSVFLASVAMSSVFGRGENLCDERCLLYRDSDRHSHLVLQIGHGFLGVLEQYRCTTSTNDFRQFDFYALPAGDAATDIKRARKCGQIANVSVPIKLLTPAKWSGISRRQQKILDACIRELTRASNSKRTDRAAVVVGQRVVGSRVADSIICPYLDAAEKYVVFGGNGKRRGMGYQLVGKRDTGWLSKCRYPISESNKVRNCYALLKELDKLRTLFGFVVVGINRSSCWFSHQDLLALNRRRSGWSVLREINLRIYAPSNIQDKFVEHFAERGGFASKSNVTNAAHSMAQLPLAVRIERLGLTQEELAALLNVDRTYLNKMLNVRRPFPADLAERLESILVASERPQALSH